jgi:subtilisin-like proprotein convertase family protein
MISFVLVNTNGFAMKVTDLSAYFNPAVIGGNPTGSSMTLWYSTTSLSGDPGTLAGPNWTVGATSTLGAIGAAGVYPVFTGMNIQIPAGQTFRFAMQSTLGITYSGGNSAPSVNNFTGGGVILGVGDYQIGGLNVGYAGDAPSGTRFNPRFFMGCVTVDQAVCIPNVSSVPVISSVPSSTCAGSPITLNIIGGSLNGAANWVWYSGGSCGGASVGSGTSITVSPGVTTTYSVRGEGGCAPAPGPCASQTVTVTPCTCLTPDVATICAGTIQALSVTTTGTTTQTFTAVAPNIPISIPSAGISTPYPSQIPVASLPAAGVYVQSVAIDGFTHTWPGDVDIVLQSPAGRNVILMSDIGDGGPNGVFGRNLVLSDAAANPIPVPIANGTWKPTNSVGTFGVEPDNFPAPGPGSVAQPNPTLSSFLGTDNPNGNWKLFVVDDTGGDLGSIASWSITFLIVPTASWTSGSPGTMWANPAATIPYVLGSQASTIYVNPTTTTTYTANFAAGPCAPSQSVTVNVLPKPDIIISPNGGCAPVTLTASGGNPATYVWSPSAGLNTTTGATVVASPSSNQTYTVVGYGLNGCKNSASVNVGGTSTASVITAAIPQQLILSEGFDAAALPAGWSQNNLSSPLGTGPFSVWWQGTVGGVLLPPPFGSDYRGCAFLSGSGLSTISNWMISPVVTTQVGDKLTFWTNGAPPAFPDRLQVRWSDNGASTNVGASATSVGDFSNLWVDINPTYSLTGYPSTWTRYTVNITGVAPFVAGTGRLAFRYFVENGGPAGANSNFIGVDSVRIARPLPGWCPNTVSTIAVNITGGVAPFTLVYSNGSTQTTYPGYTSGTPIQVSPAATTTYTVVSVTGANGCLGFGNTGSATVVVVPPPSITSQPANQTVCVGGTAVIAAGVSPAVSTTTYQWQESTNGGATYTNIVNGGIYSGATTATLTITGVTAGMNGYWYRIVVTGQCAPTTVTSSGAILTVNQPPAVTTNPVNRTVCTGSSVSFTAAGTTAVGTVTYQWQVSTDGGITWNNISGATSATYTFVASLSQTGNMYRCVLTVAPCTATATTTVATLRVNPLPNVVITCADVSITPGQTTVINGTSTPAAVSGGWSWTLNGNVVPPPPAAPSNTPSITVGIDGLGTYQASATDANGCSNLSNTLVIGAEASNHLWIYPNPNNGNFQIRLYYDGEKAERRKVRIYNAIGQLVAQKEFELVTGSPSYLKMEFSLPRLAAGTYVAKVSSVHSGMIVSGLFVIAQ